MAVTTTTHNLPRTTMTTESFQEKVERPWRGAIAFGYAMIFGFFFLFGGWAATAPLASAVRAQAEVQSKTKRQIVQHQTGGTVEEILVKEGDFVSKGDILIRMEPLLQNTQYERLQARYFKFLAERGRLEAQRAFAEDVTFSQELMAAAKADPELATLLQSERTLYLDSLQTYLDEEEITRERIRQIELQIETQRGHQETLEIEVGLIDEEMAGIRTLVEKELTPLTRLRTVERQRTRIAGAIEQVDGVIAGLRQRIQEQEMRIVAARNQRLARALDRLVALEASIDDNRARFALAQQGVDRIEVKAPMDGNIINLAVHTQGQVISGGQRLMEVIPDDRFVVIGSVKPKDIDSVKVGSPVQVRFSAFNPRTTPPVEGVLTTVARDTEVGKGGPRSKPSYRVEVQVDQETLDRIPGMRLSAGMPANVQIAVGERTLLTYWMTPLLISVEQSFREP